MEITKRNEKKCNNENTPAAGIFEGSSRLKVCWVDHLIVMHIDVHINTRLTLRLSLKRCNKTPNTFTTSCNRKKHCRVG
jgi:hypothetical protein